MKSEHIEEAASEAKRFLERVDALSASLGGNLKQLFGGYSKESGALRRASMDLTRALAKMRKPS